MNKRSRVLTAAAVAATIAGGLLTGFAGGSDAGNELEKPPAIVESPDVAKEDITRPGEKSTYKLFRNGRVYTVHAKLKREQVTKANGTRVERITEGQIDTTGLPPIDPDDKRVPTPEQLAEMNAVANPGPPDDPSDMKAIVAANP